MKMVHAWIRWMWAVSIGTTKVFVVECSLYLVIYASFKVSPLVIRRISTLFSRRSRFFLYAQMKDVIFIFPTAWLVMWHFFFGILFFQFFYDFWFLDLDQVGNHNPNIFGHIKYDTKGIAWKGFFLELDPLKINLNKTH